MATAKFYKIRQRGTGLWSTGSSGRPSWKHTGRIWTGMGALKLHLFHVSKRRHGRASPYYDDVEIVEFELVPTGVEKDISTLLQEQAAARTRKEEKQAEARRKAQEKRDLAQLRYLESKYPNRPRGE